MSGPYPTTYSNNLQMSEQKGSPLEDVLAFRRRLIDEASEEKQRARAAREAANQGIEAGSAPVRAVDSPVLAPDTQVQTDLSGPVGDAIAEQAQVAQTAQQGGDSYSRILAKYSTPAEISPGLTEAEMSTYRSLGGGQFVSPRVRYAEPQDYTLPAKQYERDLAEIEKMQAPESFQEAQRIATQEREKLNAARFELMAYNPSPAGLKGFSSKFFAALSISLGEMARGLRGGKGQNIGLDMINKIVDDEARRQKQEYERLKDRVNFADNAYAKAYQVLGDERQAFNLTKDALLSQAEKKSDMLGDQIKNTEAYQIYKTNLQNEQAKLRADATNANVEKGQAMAEAYLEETMKLKAQGGSQLKLDKRKEFLDDANKLGAVSADVNEALVSLDKYLNNIGDKVISPNDKQGIKTILKEAAALPQDISEADFFGKFKSIITRDLLADKDLLEFYNVIGKVAFGLASKDQAASSISNRDVSMFRDFLADPVKNKQAIRAYLNKFKILSTAGNLYNRVLANYQGPRDPLRVAEEARDKYLISQGLEETEGVWESNETKAAEKALGVYGKMREFQ